MKFNFGYSLGVLANLSYSSFFSILFHVYVFPKIIFLWSIKKDTNKKLAEKQLLIFIIDNFPTFFTKYSCSIFLDF